MEIESRTDYAKYRLERALENLKIAIELLDSNKLKFANNRAYYSIFHSMRAILALDGKDFKKHSGVIAYFNQYYIKTKLFPVSLHDLISNASEIRNASDYDDFYIASIEETQEQVESAKLIYDLVKKYIENQEQ